MSKDAKTAKKYKALSVLYLVLAILFYVYGGLYGLSGLLMIFMGIGGEDAALSIGGVEIDDDLYEEFFDSHFFGDNLSATSNGILVIVIAAIFVGLATMFIFLYRKYRSKFEQASKSIAAEEQSNDFGGDLGDNIKIEIVPDEELDTPKERIFCAYCGGELDPKDKRCPNCGATKKIKKKVD